MTLLEQAIEPLKKYADFKGRASRSEFWIFFAFVLILQAGARLIDALMGRGLYLPGPVTALAGLLLIVPQIAVTIRRLHDINRSGREMVAPLVMLLAMPLVIAFSGLLGRMVALGYVGVVLILFANLLVMLTRKGSSIPNRYGKAPTAFSFAR